MRLLSEQEDLLVSLVEASRAVPRREQRFRFVTNGRLEVVMGPGSFERGVGVFGHDLRALQHAGLVDATPKGKGGLDFAVSAAGFDRYEEIRGRSTDIGEAVEEDVRRHLDGERFKARFSAAHERLVEAEELLWAAHPGDDLTTIGHKLREAIQRFATEMVTLHKPVDVEADPQRSLNRLRAVLEMHRDRLGDRRSDLLDALLGYANATNGIVQRLEHADQKAGEPATWEDARAAAFAVTLMMFEFDRALNN